VKRVFVCGAFWLKSGLFLTKIRILNFDCFAKGGREIGESFIPVN
jgi:hypothetical protein